MQDAPDATVTEQRLEALWREHLARIGYRQQQPSTSSGANDSIASERLKALSIRQPHAEAVMRGVKPIEFRSRPTHVRGRVHIYASLGRYPDDEEAEMLEMYGIDDVACDDMPRGVLIGTVDLWDCTGTEGDYSWHVRSPERAKKLLKPTKHPQPVWFNPF